MKKLSAKNKIYLIWASFLALYIVLILVFAFPLFEKIKNSSENLSLGKKATQEIYQKWFQLGESKKALDQTEQELEQVQNIVLTQQNALPLVQTIEQVAQKTGVKHALSLVGQTTETKNSLFFEVKAYGDFSSLVNFLNLMENMNYPIQPKAINIIKLSPKNISGEKIDGLKVGDLKATINFSVFTK